MGGDISSNYDQITPIFIAGVWKVHSAVHRTTREPISLWLLDEDVLQNKCKTKADREKCMANYLYSIQEIRKVHHPQILKISEVNENPKQLAFSAEPVNSCLINEVNLEPDEVEYIASQLSSALFFLHHKAKIAHLNISPHSIILTKSLSLKLCGFEHCCSITGDSFKVFPRFGEWQNSPYCPDINFTAPEIVTNKTMTQSCDIYSFGCVVATMYLKRHLFAFSTTSELVRTLSGSFSIAPAGANESMRNLLRNCLKMNSDVRPSIDEIENSDALKSLQLKVYHYLDAILTKSQAEKFNFFKSLLQSLNIFSQRMLRFKLLPILMNETLSDSRFGPATLPLIFQIGAFFDRREFFNSLLSPLSNLLTITRPPEMSLAVFSVMRILIDRVDQEKHLEILYPVYSAAFQSNDPRLHAAAVNYLPMIIKTLNTNALRTSVIPKLSEFLTVSQDPTVVSSCITALSDCVMRIDHDSYAELVLPMLTEAWKRLKNDGVGNSILEVIEKLEPSMETKMTYIIPLISNLLANQVLDPMVQVKLVNIAQSTFAQLAKDRGLDDANFVPLNNQQLPSKQENKNALEQIDNYSIDIPKTAPQNRPKQAQAAAILQQQQQQQSQSSNIMQPKQSFKKPIEQPSNQISGKDQQQSIPSWSVKNRRPEILPKQEATPNIPPPPPQPPLQQQKTSQEGNSPSQIPSKPKLKTRNSPQQQIHQQLVQNMKQKSDTDDFWGDGKRMEDDEIDTAIVEGILGESETSSRPPLKGPGYNMSGNKFQPGRKMRYYNT
ncbi:protein kinase [Tritrichomonas foetus]|uniref:Protein kinase n=1 Tax=Tritrichomonas foetus TaxID=1144522 RepID=A0A1J4KMS2_9EUKA|nr:protein kinase [Tritrichomonas foetus]|eukprot:OHT11100.1 protein kinase [Tritrichomonas foetus]